MIEISVAQTAHLKGGRGVTSGGQQTQRVQASVALNSSDMKWSQSDECPERRLWIAILATLIEDYERTVFEATKNVRRGTCERTNRGLLFHIEKLRNEARSDWMEFVCDNIGISKHHIISRFNELDAINNLAAVNWTDKPEMEFSKRTHDRRKSMLANQSA